MEVSIDDPEAAIERHRSPRDVDVPHFGGLDVCLDECVLDESVWRRTLELVAVLLDDA